MRPQLRQLILLDLLGCLAFAVPCVVLPARAFVWLGLDLGGSPAALAFTRLFGAALGTVCVAYILHLTRPGRDHTRLIALTANGFIAAVLWILIFRGHLLPLPFLGKVVLTGSAIATTILGLLMLIAAAGPPQPPGLAGALEKRENSPLPAATKDEGDT